MTEVRRGRARGGAWLVALAMTGSIALAADEPQIPGPSFRDVLGLRTVGGVAIAPDGGAVAFTMRSIDWESNRWDTEIWLANDGEEPFQLTRTDGGSSTRPAWSPDGRWIAFAADRGDGRQVHAIRASGGEAVAVTSASEGVGGFAWSPDGTRIAYTSEDETSKEAKAREERYGKFAFEDQESGIDHLWLIDFAPAPWPSATEAPCEEPAPEEDGSDSEAEEGCVRGVEARRLTEGDDFSVNDFLWSPDGSRIAIDTVDDTLITSYHTSDISLLDVESGELTPLVEGPGWDGVATWSPDGESLIYVSSAGDTVSDYYRHAQILKISAEGGETVRLAEAFDGQLGGLDWTPRGLYGAAWRGTERHLFEIDPETGAVELVADAPERIFGLDFSADGEQVVFSGHDGKGLTDVYQTRIAEWSPRAVTKMDRQIESWELPRTEVIAWPSRDGTEVEGVLYTPKDFDPSAEHPLLVVIHGGPAGIDFPDPLPSYVYPIAQWVAKGAVVLRPNYRGSIGYGQDFQALNVRNLGVGDAWDVLSGVDHLVERGFIDEDRMGAMGWSQGGYISAFLTTNSDRFSAISVGAGISNWMTYYVNTDIHPFTRQYLKATPWEDPEIYALTSPMTKINDASTPTLIQHGENDRRVPIPNAYELYQGLSDVGVPTELVVYEGFGHGITKPKERLAAIWHNWQWFLRYLWEEEVEPPLGLDAEEDAAPVE